MPPSGRDVLAGLLPAIASLHGRSIIHTDVKPANILLRADPSCARLDGHQVCLADLGHAIINTEGCRHHTAPEEVSRRGSLYLQTWPWRCPSIQFGCDNFGPEVDEWSAGVVGWGLFHGKRMMGHDEEQLVQRMVEVCGAQELQENFKGLPLWRDLPKVVPKNARQNIPTAGLLGNAALVLGGLLETSPAQRHRAEAILEGASGDWFRTRPILRPCLLASGSKGPVAIRAGMLNHDVLQYIRADPFFSDDKQKELGLSWETLPTDPILRQATELESNGPIKKLTFCGHYGRGSASLTINNLRNDKPMPVHTACVAVSWVVEHNRWRLQALMDCIKKHIHLQFAKNDIPKATGRCKPAQANTKDFLHGDPFRFVLTAPQIHLSTGTGAMPKHFDGGRGAIVLAISLWSRRSLRVYLANGGQQTIGTGSGHVYLANLIGAEHQVLHTDPGRNEDFARSKQLGEYEAVIFVRSATFRHVRCSNAGRLWNDDLDGQLCRAFSDAYTEWHCSAASALELPNLQDLLDAEAAMRLQDIKPNKVDRISDGSTSGKPQAKKRRMHHT